MPPLTWLDAIDDSDASVMELAAWIQSLHRSVANDLLSRIESLCGKAARGEIVSGDGELEPITSDPEMYELRWDLLSKKVRQYHAEPDEYPAHLVKLHIHIKVDAARNTPRPRSQQDEINWAIRQYRPR